jgi:hypothetical protein
MVFTIDPESVAIFAVECDKHIGWMHPAIE